jgi:CheY-like chemotaxis protein
MKKNILIIDNDSLLIDDLLKAFNGLNCCVKSADTGFEGLGMLHNEHFDIVIIDLYALGFDGEELARCIRLQRSTRTPIVIGLSENPCLIKNNGFDRAFATPVSMNDLFEIVKYCSGSRKAEVKLDEVQIT